MLIRATEPQRLSELYDPVDVAAIGRERDDEVGMRIAQQLRAPEERPPIVGANESDEGRAAGQRAEGHRASELRIAPEEHRDAHRVAGDHAKDGALGGAGGDPLRPRFVRDLDRSHELGRGGHAAVTGVRFTSATNASKIRVAAAATCAVRSGCHCTATTQRCAGDSSASTSSATRAVARSSDARRSGVTPRGWLEFTGNASSPHAAASFEPGSATMM